MNERDQTGVMGEESLPAERYGDDLYPDEQEDLSIAEKVVGVYVSPISTFRYLANRPDFWSALIILSLIGIAIAMVVLPKQLPVTQSFTVQRMQEQFESQGMPESQMNASLSAVQTGVRIATYVQSIIGPPIGLAIIWLLYCALIFFIALIQGLDTDYKRLLGVMPWIHFISILSQIGTAVVIVMRGIPDMDHMRDPRWLKPFSLAGLVPDSVDLHISLNVLLSAIDPFFIWAFILTIIALQYANRCTRSQALTTTIIATIISLAFGTGLAAVGSRLAQFGG